MAERYYDGEPEVYATGEAKAGDIERLITDNSRLGELGVEPSVGLEEGVDRLYEWFHDGTGERTEEVRVSGSGSGGE
jgi:nucleoside-diphosphate-sugar epimerase